MQIEQFVMAYEVEQDRLRALLPDGFQSLRPVLRVNAELRGGLDGYVEFNTAVEKAGKRGWLNLGHWEHVPFTQTGKTVEFRTGLLRIRFTGVGLTGGCPAERDNVGCFFGETLRPAEQIAEPKEFCDCEFQWELSGGAHGVSQGKTLPAHAEPQRVCYSKIACTVEHAAVIPCRQVLGSYIVRFERAEPVTP